jgi:hypothetical protein
MIKSHFLLIILVMLLGFSACHQKEHKKIAFIGRYDDLEGKSGSNEWYDQYAFLSMESFVESFNDTSKTLSFTLEKFNIHHDPELSDSVYQLIAGDEDFLFVLDNSWGHDLAGARQTILTNKIPVISINADKNQLDYGPQAIFLIDYQRDIEFLTTYADKVLERDTIDFISETDIIFHKYFLQSIDQLDLDIERQFSYKGQQNINTRDSLALFSSLYEYFVKEGRTDGRLVLYNSHFMWGNAIVDFLNDHLTNSTFMSWSVPQPNYIGDLKNGNRIILHHHSFYDVSEPVFKSYQRLLAKYPQIFLGMVRPVSCRKTGKYSPF